MSLSLGLVIYLAVKPIFKIYFIIALGYFLAKKNIFTVTTCRDISDAVVTAIMPCLIFNNVVLNLKSSDIKNIGVIFFEGTLLTGVGFLLAFAVAIITKSPKRWLGGCLSVGLFPNISDLPIAYMQTLLKGESIFSLLEGDKGVAYICIFLAAQIFYQFSLGLYQLVAWDFRETETENEKRSVSESNSQPEQLVPEIAVEDSSLESIDSNYKADHEEFLRQRENSDQGNRRPSSSTSHTSATSNTNYYSLGPVTLRTVDLRQLPSQDIDDVIHEYSEIDRLRHHDPLDRTITAASEVGLVPIELPKSSTDLFSTKARAYLYRLYKNFTTPNSMSLIISIIIAMAPPLRSLFVQNDVFYIHLAPDNQPPLSFVMDICLYVGAASVPLGLLLLGATISRLKVKLMPPGFWKTAVGLTLLRLVIMPIFGVGLSTGLNDAGWFGNDDLVRFVTVLEFGLPSATSLIYFTAFYTDPTAEEHLQMDCLAVVCIAQYLVLWITLPILITFTVKVSLGM